MSAKQILVVLFCVLAITACGSTTGDLILHGGRVLTLAEPEPAPPPTALVVTGDRIELVGTDAEALARRTARTRVVDLAGAVVIPGFIDGHAHLYGLGKYLAEADLVGTRSATEAVGAAVRTAAGLPPGAWVQGRGWDQNDWEKKEFPHRELLDAEFPDRPVFLRRIDGHAAWVNSEALRLAGIDAATTDPPGGRIVRDSAGNPTGILIDEAATLVRSIIPPTDPAEIRRRLDLAMDHCLGLGLTGVHEAGARAARVSVYREMAAAGELEIRVFVMLEDDKETLDELLPAGPFGSPDGMLTVGGVKLYADGALGSRGALLLADYSDDPGNLGLQVTPTAHLAEVAERAGRARFQVCTHAIGDGGNRLVLDIYEKILGELDRTDHRWRIEHAQVLHPADLPRFAGLGVLAAMQPVHCTSDMDWAGARLGPEREPGAYAWRTLLDSGARVLFGTDFPVEAVDPVAGLFAARTRTHPNGTPAGGWHPKQCLDGRTALKLYTLEPAFGAFQEGDLGPLRPGRWADLTILNGDPTECAPADLLSLEVLYTIVGGKILYAADR